VLSLLETTQQLLEQRAATSELSSQPQPYDVLYDFYCMRSNFKAAAAAQYSLACRLKDEAKRLPDRLHQRAAALCKPSAICCITLQVCVSVCLCPVDCYAWLALWNPSAVVLAQTPYLA